MPVTQKLDKVVPWSAKPSGLATAGEKLRLPGNPVLPPFSEGPAEVELPSRLWEELGSSERLAAELISGSGMLGAGSTSLAFGASAWHSGRGID